MAEVRIGKKVIGDGHPCYLVGEIGINHNGDPEIARHSRHHEDVLHTVQGEGLKQIIG